MFPKAKGYVPVLLLVLGLSLFNGPTTASAKTQAGQVINPAPTGFTTFESGGSALLPADQSSSGPYGQVYFVRQGDTLFSIARRFGVSVQAILAANPGIRNPNRIFAGQQLIIPPGMPAPQVYLVQRGDTLFRIAFRFGTNVQALLAANPGIRNPNRIFAGQQLIIPTRFGAPYGGYNQPGYGSYNQPGYGGYNQPPYGGYNQPGYGGGYGQQSAPGPQPSAGQVQIVMQNVSFQPQQITVPPGTTVTWVNRDNFAHTVTSGTRGSPSGLFDSGNVAAGGSFSFTFQTPGPYPYFCQIHNGMNGTVVVQTTGQQPMYPPPAPQRPTYGGY
jgi:plastocyanin/phage tail protein X